MRRAVIVPAEFVLAAELNADRLAELLRHDGRGLRRFAVATAPEGVRSGVVLHANLFDRETQDSGQAVALRIDAWSEHITRAPSRVTSAIAQFGAIVPCDS